MHRLSLVLIFLAATAEARPREVSVELSSADPRAAAAELLGPGAELQPLQSRASLTGSHVRFRTLAVDGTRVLGQEAAVHFVGTGPRLTARVIDDRGRGLWTVVGARTVGEDEARGLAATAVAGGAVRSAERVAIPVGPYLARPGWRVLVDAQAPRRLVEVLVDAADGGVTIARKNLLRNVTGTGWVYRPNPVTASGDHSLRDNNDADSQVLTDLREQVTLEGLDGSGLLRGEYVDVFGPRARTSNSSLTFNFTRSQDSFEEVSAYYHIDRVQRQIQALGYTGSKALIDRPMVVRVNVLTEDNSYFDASLGERGEIETGIGGVDDAEDGDILAHEYGHAIQEEQVPGFGNGDDAAGMGEGFSDIQAWAMPTGSTKAPKVPRACLGSWDATAYSTPSECLRRVDGTKHYPEHLHTPDREEHFDGELWSGAMFAAFAAANLDPIEGYRLLLESQFLYSADETFLEAAEALVRTDETLFGGSHATALRRALIWRGLWSGFAEPATVDPSRFMAVAKTAGSPSPIPNNADGQIVLEQPGATAMRVRFATLDMEEGTCADGGSQCDAVYLYDKDGEVYARLGGRGTNVLSPIIPGDKVTVRWVTTPSVPSTGFTIDRLEVIMGAPPSPDAGVPDAGPVGTADARPGRPVTGDATGGCAVGGGAGGSSLLLGLLVALSATSGRWRARRRPCRSRS